MSVARIDSLSRFGKGVGRPAAKCHGQQRCKRGRTQSRPFCAEYHRAGDGRENGFEVDLSNPAAFALTQPGFVAISGDRYRVCRGGAWSIREKASYSLQRTAQALYQSVLQLIGPTLLQSWGALKQMPDHSKAENFG